MLAADVEQRFDEVLQAATVSPPEEVGWYDGSSPVVIFGAGTLGREVAEKLRRAGIEPVAFVDETPGKAGSTVDGLVVHDLEGALKSFSNAVVTVAIWNPNHRFLSTRTRLLNAGFRRVASFVHAAYAFPHLFLPHYAFDRREATLNHAAELRQTATLFDDDRSRQQFLQHVRFRLTLDFEALPENSPEKYFRGEFASVLNSDTVLIDCGAYNGDTVSDFVRLTGGVFGSVIAIEPQAENFARLAAAIERFEPAMRSKIRLIRAAVADRSGTARFHNVPGEGSFLAEGGDGVVETVSLDDVVGETAAPYFVKMDIEGAEQAALQGSVGLLRGEPRPALAVSVYHRVEDLWRIPQFIRAHGDYRLFLRTEGDDGMGIVCYAF